MSAFDKTRNMLQGVAGSPFHISVGAVVTNERGEICCHHFQSSDLHEMEGASDLYQLMRETLSEDETLKEAVHRGIQEEFGIIGEIKAYLGSVVSSYPLPKSGTVVQKTTLYFHVAAKSVNLELRETNDAESRSTLEWIDPVVLKEHFLAQREKYERTDHDESSVLERYLQYEKS